MAAMKSVQGHSASLLVGSRNVPKLKRSEEGGGQENRVISNARSSTPSPNDIEFVSCGFQKVFGVSNHNPVGGERWRASNLQDPSMRRGLDGPHCPDQP
eukprot:4368777-Pyramimonas_sp.AAC.1